MDFVKFSVENQVGVLTISRPKALNALNDQVIRELDAALDSVDCNEVRCIIVTGEGEKAFVAGADIAQMSALTKAEGEAFGKLGNDVFRKLETLPVPTIAAINGFALGGGCELAMSCDIRLASETAVFGQPEVGLGITPGFGGTQRMARLIGPGQAKRLIYTAQNGASCVSCRGTDASGYEDGCTYRFQCAHCRPRLQESHQRWFAGGYGPGSGGGRAALRFLF